MERVWAVPVALALTSFGAACVSDHDALVRRDPPGSGGGAGSSDSGAGLDGSVDAEAGEERDVAAPDRDSNAPDSAAEPNGPDRLTLFHGVVDAPRLSFCIVRQPGQGPPEPLEPLLPPTGLDYATPLVVDALAGVDSTTDALQVIVVAGDASVLGASSCAEAFSLPEPAPGDGSVAPDAATSDGAAAKAWRVHRLPTLPATTLAKGRSIVLVATGCLGAPEHDSPTRETICGQGYAPGRPTLSMVLAPMSRLTSSGRLGLQALHASRATDSVGVVSMPPPGSTAPALFVASDVVYGQMAPRFANLQHSKLAHGTPLEAAQIAIRRKAPGGDLSVRWGDALTRGGLTTVDEGNNYTVVFVGPQMGSTAEWSNPSTVTIVRSDPAP
jgi:hypothetical protein